MNEFFKVIGQIFLIACIQLLFENFINIIEKPYLSKFLGITCYLASLYVIIQFVQENIWQNVSQMFYFFQ